MTRSLTFIVPGDIARRTGGYEYDRRLIEALRGRGWQVTLRQLGEGFPFPDRDARADALSALRELADGSLVVVDGLAFGALPDEAAAHRERLRLVALVHHPLALERQYARELFARLKQDETRALRSARQTVVTSAATAETLGDFGVPPDRVSVVVPGTRRVEASTGSGSAQVQLLCVASMIERKGHLGLIQALACMPDLPWTLTCVGRRSTDPAFAARLRDALERSGLEGRVVFAGELSEPELEALYAGADIFVFPSLYEGYGMAVAEAVAHGLPVIASDTGGVAEILAGDAGVIVPPGDVRSLESALRRLVLEPTTRAELAAGARRVRNRLPSWEEAGQKMEAILQRVAAS